jgi:hypothetical protein
MKNAVTIDGDFTWETAGKLEGGKFAVGAQESRLGGGKAVRKGKGPNGKSEAVLPTIVPAEKVRGTETEDSSKRAEEKPFELRDVKFSVPKGAFVAIVGRVGSGKVCPLIPMQRFNILMPFILELFTSRPNWRNAENERRGMDILHIFST